jgi:glycosyltransferase involved in cell wall biosynthesis
MSSLNKRKKITVLVSNDLTTDQRMQKICQSLERHDFDVTFLGRRLSKNQETFSEKYGFHWGRLSLFFLKGKAFYLELNFRLFLFLLFRKMDLVVAVDYDTLPAAWLNRKVKGVDYFFDAHEYFTEVPELEGRKFSKMVWSWVGKICIPSAHTALTVNASLANLYQNHFDKKFTYIRNCPQARHCSDFGLGYSSKRMVYQGALNKGRGLESAILAMQSLKDYTLELYGIGDKEVELKEMVGKLGLQSQVLFMGRKSPEVLKLHTVGAFCGLNLLERYSKNYYYSLANKFFDYVQAGVPVITMDFPEYRNLNQEHSVALLLEDCGPEHLIRAVGELEQESVYRDLVAQMKSASEKWVWEKEESRLLNLFFQYFKMEQA